jgi:RHS repeat-associated protein
MNCARNPSPIRCAVPCRMRSASQPLAPYNRSHMQPDFRSAIPDASLAVFTVNGGKPHQGFTGRNPAPNQGREVCNSTVLLGLRGQAELNRIGSCCTGKERDSESGLDMFGARYYTSSMGRFMTPDWANKAIAIPYADLGNPQSLNLYAYVNNNPTTVRDPDGHGDAMTFCNAQCLYGTPVSQSEVKVDLGVIELAGAALAGPEVLALAGNATTVLQTLAVGTAALSVTGTAVNGTVDIAGGLTHTNVDDATNHVTSVTNPAAAAVSLVAGSAKKGSDAADLATVAKAGVNLIQGKGLSNPPEVIGSLAGAKSAVQEIYYTVKSGVSGPVPPPPPTPKLPPCYAGETCN